MNLIAHEDEHLLVANKPPGWNTHAPSPFANEGLHEWLKHREPRWSRLAILHRLDKETSGLIVFGKTAEANRSLTQQFESRAVSKKYILLTDRASRQTSFVAKSHLLRLGEKYGSRPPGSGGQSAETRFKFLSADGANFVWEAEPLTGRTHQIRAHASEHGIPILGDRLYGGTPAPRVCLHAAELAFAHPATNQPLVFRAAPNFFAPVSASLRAAIIDSAETDIYRVTHGAADGWPGLHFDRFNGFLLAASEAVLTPAQLALVQSFGGAGVYHRRLTRDAGKQSAELISGRPAPPEGFAARENGMKFKIRFGEGGSVGLFLDQRENRRRLLTGYVAADFTFAEPREVLNAFAYTCSFSVCAAARGARVTSVDLSRKYLDWGRENFLENGLDPSRHDFLHGDCLTWFGRLARKQRLFDIVLLDPPTFSRSKEGGVFQAEKDYNRLTAAALPLVKPGGLLFASTNAAGYAPEDFMNMLEKTVHQNGRKITRRHYVPQPPDFPIHRMEPAYLKTLWLELQ